MSSKWKALGKITNSTFRQLSIVHEHIQVERQTIELHAFKPFNTTHSALSKKIFIRSLQSLFWLGRNTSRVLKGVIQSKYWHIFRFYWSLRWNIYQVPKMYFNICRVLTSNPVNFQLMKTCDLVPLFSNINILFYFLDILCFVFLKSFW